MSETLVDARGLRCPWPAIRLARAMREGGAAAQVRILADDPAAPREIAALAEERGWGVERADTATTACFLVRSGMPGVNRIFTSIG